MARLRLTHLLLARIPSGMAARVKTKVKAGPASTSYLIPTGEYSQVHGTPLSAVQLVLEGVGEGRERGGGRRWEEGRERKRKEREGKLITTKN